MYQDTDRSRYMSFIRGTNRNQIQIISSLDEMIAKDNPVRLLDEFVNGLNLQSSYPGQH